MRHICNDADMSRQFQTIDKNLDIGVSGFAKKRNFFLPEKRYDMFLLALIFNECSDKDGSGTAVAVEKLC